MTTRSRSTPARHCTPPHRSAHLFGALMIALWGAPLSRAHAAAPPVGYFDLQLTTTRGCLETGEHPVYTVGESITVSFHIGSDTAQHASATLFDILPNGRVGVIAFGGVSTNRTHAFAARVALPAGVEQLQLKAVAPGVQTTRRSCSFVVVAGPTPTATMTPPTTATPTPSPPTTVTATVTPGAALGAVIRTNRGCIETGDDPVFAVGESILVSLRINSPSQLLAQASLLDILANGFVQTFGLGLVRTNATLQFRARIAPPTGVEVLQLRARAFHFRTAVDACSFQVVHTPPAATRTRAPTASPTPTGTETATATPTPSPTPA